MNCYKIVTNGTGNSQLYLDYQKANTKSTLKFKMYIPTGTILLNGGGEMYIRTKNPDTYIKYGSNPAMAESVDVIALDTWKEYTLDISKYTELTRISMLFYTGNTVYIADISIE